ncbi:hypothetical protein [Streptomyces venezuelae]|uniref:hypothetical protein n=1 Tax=Streptomyces venezuelae TaxID=54571 RepID=UPI00341B0EE8
MTDPRNREHSRAVRAYQRSHPGTTLDQARRAVADRAARRPAPPAPIPGAPLPRPAEQLGDYVGRVAAAAGVQRHRAMELLGLTPGTSATRRLHELADGLDEATVQALVSATGMTAAQARALTAPPATGGQSPDLENLARRLLEDKHLRPGGAGKTSSAPGEMAAAISLAIARRARMTDTAAPGTPQDDVRDLAETYGSRIAPADLPVNELFPDRYRPVITDLKWPFDTPRPIDPQVFDEVTEALGLELDTTFTSTPPRE